MLQYSLKMGIYYIVLLIWILLFTQMYLNYRPEENMKRFLSFIIALLLVASLVACDRGYLGEDPLSTTTTAATTTTTSPATTTTTATTTVATTAATNTDVDDIVAILNANGYTLTVHDTSSIAYFTTNTLENNYGISVTVTDLIMGDVNANDWIQLVGFASEADAIAYENALSTLDGGELYYRNGTAVLLTYSQNALDLFD